MLYMISFVQIADYTRREVLSGLFASNYAPPVSVNVPAHDEEATLAASVCSFLALHYPLFEIVVVNEGSKDGTLEFLKKEFGLRQSDQPVRIQLETRTIKGIYAGKRSVSLFCVNITRRKPTP